MSLEHSTQKRVTRPGSRKAGKKYISAVALADRWGRHVRTIYRWEAEGYLPKRVQVGPSPHGPNAKQFVLEEIESIEAAQESEAV